MMKITIPNEYVGEFRITDTLKNTSYDDTNERYLSLSEMRVIWFDKVKRQYIRCIGKACQEVPSVDALFSDENGKVYFAEFKNSKINNLISHEVAEKAYNSLLIHMDITKTTASYTRDKAYLILVYSEDKNSSSKDIIARHLGEKAKIPNPKVNFEKLRKVYFDDVYTYTDREFEAKILANDEVHQNDS